MISLCTVCNLSLCPCRGGSSKRLCSLTVKCAVPFVVDSMAVIVPTMPKLGTLASHLLRLLNPAIIHLFVFMRVAIDFGAFELDECAGDEDEEPRIQALGA
jgi:hypothetical protein